MEAARYSHGGPALVTFFNVKSTATGSGAHAGLAISGSERVLFDPAGTFAHTRAPERNDVHYGVTDEVLRLYVDYHARETYDVEILEIEVSRAEADALIRAAEAHGPVPKGQCAVAVTRVLRETPGFSSLPVTWFPNAVSEAIAGLPGAERRLVTDDDADDNRAVLARAGGEAVAPRD